MFHMCYVPSFAEIVLCVMWLHSVIMCWMNSVGVDMVFRQYGHQILICFVEDCSDVCLLCVSIDVFQLLYAGYVESRAVMAFVVYYS